MLVPVLVMGRWCGSVRDGTIGELSWAGPGRAENFENVMDREGAAKKSENVMSRAGSGREF